MTGARGRILLVDDEPEMCSVLVEGLRRRKFVAEGTTSAEDALGRLAGGDFETLVADLRMPGMGGGELCRRVAENRPDVPVIVITAFGSLETAVEAIRAGAYDFIPKPFETDGLALALDRSVERHRLGVEVRRLREEASRTNGDEEILGSSRPMRVLFELISRVAATDSTVLVTGETGTGKDLVARAIHRRSARAGGPFVVVNCSALPEPLLESELFGHVKGAFTHATDSRQGLVLAASGGTLYLDEIGEMSSALQAKLLRALQERVVRPVGSDQELPFDVRLVAATHHDLETAVEEGRFRSDLFYRIHVIRVELPPLRARGGDILVLAQHFVNRFAGASGKPVRAISPAAAGRLLAYSWPGNVRELENAIQRAVALTRFEELMVEDLPERVREYRSSHIIVAGDDLTELVRLEEVERRYVLRVLEAAAGNKSLAARILGLDRKTLYRKLERYGAAGMDDTPDPR